MLLQGELFDVEECVRENAKIRAELESRERKAAYGRMEFPRPNIPDNDDGVMLRLQTEWLAGGSVEARRELMDTALVVLRRLLWGEMKRRGLHFTEEDQLEKCAGAMLYLFRRYEKAGGYVVRKSFVSALKYALRHELDYRKTDDTVAVESDIAGGFEWLEKRGYT